MNGIIRLATAAVSARLRLAASTQHIPICFVFRGFVSHERKRSCYAIYFEMCSRIIVLTILTCAVFVLGFGIASAQGQLENPLNPSFSSIPAFISGALKVVVMVALPLIALAFVYSGFLFVSAQGNPTKLGIAQKNFMYTVIGAILILGAWVIATLIGGTVTQLVG